MKIPAVVDRLIVPLYVVLVLALLYAIVQTVLFFVFGTGNQNDTDLSGLEEWDIPRQVSADDIINANLFGKLPEGSVEQVIEETTLNLRLVGISYNAEDPMLSRAYIIGRSKASAMRKGIGERIEGIAEITDIFEDHVLLMRGGKKESLFVEARARLISATDETSFIPEHPAQSENLIANAHMAQPQGLRTGDILVSVNGFKIGLVQENIAYFVDHLIAESLELGAQLGETKTTLNHKPNQ